MSITGWIIIGTIIIVELFVFNYCYRVVNEYYDYPKISNHKIKISNPKLEINKNYFYNFKS